MQRSSDRYLIRAVADIVYYTKGIDPRIPVLTPKKHLIGESHNASRFDEAVTDWGWPGGAAVMREGLNTHPAMRDLNAEQRTADPEDESFGAKPLESTVAKSLAEIVLLRSYMDRLERSIGAYETNENAIAKLANPTPADGPVKLKPRIAGNLKTTSASIYNRWGEFQSIVANARAYASSVPSSARAALTAANDLHDQLIDHGSGFDNGARLLLGEIEAQATETGDACKVRGGLVKIMLRQVDKLAVAFHAIMVQDLRQESPDLLDSSRGEGKDIGADTLLDRTKSSAQTLSAMFPAREHFMAQNIAGNLDKPALVQVGSHHLPGLKARNIPDVVTHDDYDAFKQATYSVLPPRSGEKG